MRKYIILAMGILTAVFARSQSETFPENFDGNNITFTSSPASAWKGDTGYYVSSRNSIRGVVPNMAGDSILLTSAVYDFSTYSHVLLRFKHICKISPQDMVRIEYKITGQGWQAISAASYLGKALLYQTKGFNAASYTEWKAEDSLALPLQSWWKEEVFDVSTDVGLDDEVQFRFILKHGNTSGTQISYGWLIDDIEIIASSDEVKLPVVEFVTPLVKEILYSTGPYAINAKVKTTSNAPIETPWFFYTASNSQETVKDSVLMTMVSGDSLWKAAIPQHVPGTEVVYSITGKDTAGNTASDISGYVIVKPVHHYGDTSVALTFIDSPLRGQTMGGVTTPVTATIRNKGDAVLTSATIYWSINGVTQEPYNWTGNLLWDFEQQLTLDTYQPRMEGYDTIVIWVSNPNGIADINLTDDTLTVIAYGCVGAMSGTYTVGEGGVFPDLKAALSVLNFCPPVGSINFLLQTGIYQENLDLTNISNLMGNYSLTITSAKADADSVILRPASGVGIKLENSNHVEIKAITVDAATNGTYAVQFTGACSNVVIRDCKLLANTTAASTAYSCIYKATSTGIADSIFIINNLLDGGYHGFRFYGGTSTSAFGTNVVFDSNKLSNQYYYGVYAQYVDFISCSYNTLQSRTTNTGRNWIALFLNSSNGTVIGNRIIQLSNNITDSYGIYAQGFNYYNAANYHRDTNHLIANNEIILNIASATSTYAGIYATTAIAKILHNSIYISGTGTAIGINVIEDAGNYITVKNNSIVMESIDAYPIYLSSTANLALYDMDYNNMYAPTYVGYASVKKETISDWQKTISTDKNSISIRPSFINSAVDLKVADYLPLSNSVLSEVGTDIENSSRTGNITAMGCYHGIAPYTVNAALGQISGFRTGGVFALRDTLKIQLFNTGATALSTVSLNWSINGLTQSATGITWTGSLLSGQDTVIALDEINYAQTGNNIICIWIDNLGGLQDEYSKDDTAQNISIYICQNSFNGKYSIGNGGTFSSWNAAIEQIKLCGVSGDVIFEFLPSPGLYDDIDLTDNVSLFGNNKLTITSSTGKAEDVTLKTTYWGILFDNSSHVTIEAITVDATAGNHAIRFQGPANNIVINRCILLTDPITTSTAVSCINGSFNRNKAGTIENLQITNCKIEGGNTGITLTGGYGFGYYGQNIIIDSNIFSKNRIAAVSLYLIQSNSVSYNQISPRSSNQGVTWYGIQLQLSSNSGNVIGNRIRSENPGITTDLYGISVTSVDSALVANNEIYLNSSAASTYGIYSTYPREVICLHNTVLLTGIGGNTFRAASFGASSATPISYICKNNIFVANGGITPYAIYLFDASGTAFTQNQQIDYNNYYSSGDLGYANDILSDLAAWKSTVYTDSNSVNILPNFVNVENSLELSGYALLSCDLIPAVSNDIQDSNRRNSTMMGCYEEVLKNANGVLTDILELQNGTLIVGETGTVKVVFINAGNTPLNSVNLGYSINGVTQANDFTFKKTLAKTQSDTLNLDIFSYSLGNDELKIWINSFEGGTLQDEYPLNDTLSAYVFVCSNVVTGIIPISDTSNYTTITAALQAMLTCGVGDITLLLDSGTYQENCDFSDINRDMKRNTLTVTSKSGNADDVTIKPASGAGIILSNTRNLILKDITVNVAAGTAPAIQFLNACTNIVVRDCKLLADTTTTSSSSYVVSKVANTGIADSIFFISNLVDGGYYGFYFYGGINDNLYGTNIVFDSNMITNNYYYGIYSYYVDLLSCSYNKVLSRTVQANTGLNWRALYLYNYNGPVIGNRIIQRSTAITRPYGIYTTYHNYYPIIQNQNRGIIANNEIILNTTSSYTGIYMNNSKSEILHNSIYITGSGTARGIFIQNLTAIDMVIKNNNIVLESSTGYPVSFNNSVNVDIYDIDYNNMYAPNNVAYYGGDIATMDAWRDIFPTDKHSVRLKPHFIDSTSHIELSDYTGMMCPALQNVSNDINGIARPSVTVMGAYNGLGSTFDLSLQQILCKDTSVLYPQLVPVKIEIANIGNSVNINNAAFGWSVNGIVQAPYSWVASNPLGIGNNMEITVGSFSAVENTSRFDIVVWVENVNGVKDSINWNDTATASIKVLWTGNDLSIQSIKQLIPDGVLCTEDYVPLTVNVQNTGAFDYDFAIHPATFSIRVTNPEPFRLDTVISTGEIKSGESAALELTYMFPIIVAGIYDIEVFFNSPVDAINYNDTIRNDYISGRFGLPIDEDFSNGIPIDFVSEGLNSNYKWDTVSRGVGSDTAVIPQFGAGMLAFKGSSGSMSTLSMHQLDLSRTENPALSFWYFHDAIPCEDYTDVRITTDGGQTYHTMFSLAKYNPLYGWRQYSMDLPADAVSPCVILVFEAMEKSRNGDIAQYIDRIRITARQDIAVSEIITSELTACDLEGKEVKVVLKNLTDPVLNFATTNTILTLEIKETRQRFTHVLDSGSLGSFASDTITVATGVDFAKGTHTLRAYFSSVLDVNSMNDTLEIPLVINPALSVSVLQESSAANCLTGELVVNPTVTLYNTGNMDLSNINLILQVDTGDNNIAVYALLKETYTNMIQAGSTAICMLNASYSVPWNARYNVRAYVYLSCDSALVNSTTMVPECVDTKDLRITNIDNPSGAKDATGSSILVTTTLNNRSDGDIFTNIPVTVQITNSQGVQEELFTEYENVGTSATVSHTFTQSYTVPDDTVYYLTVFIENQDKYSKNDTMTIRRETVSVGVETLRGVNGFTLSQNIPNPAKNRTRINYHIPEAGEVIFHVHSISGQLLHSQTIEAANGKQSLELNTSSFAAGIYFYSIEYKGQRLIKRMIVQ